MHLDAFSHSRLTAVTHPRFKACLQWKDTLRLRETMPRREKSRNKQVRSNLLHQFWFLTYKRSVKRSVNTLGSMYAINAEYKYSHGWLSEKKHAYQKPFMLISKPPSPRLYRFNIKLLLFLIYLKVFKVRAKKLNYFWLTHFYCFFFSFKYTWSSDFGPLLAQHMNTTHGDGTLVIRLSMSKG